MENKFYVSCPYCHKRGKRTGVKTKQGSYFDSGKEKPIYDYEYECPNCKSLYRYSWWRNLIY